MPFSKNFPRKISENAPPVWEEIVLTLDEEREVTEACKREHFQIMDMCLQEAKALAIKNGLNTDENQIQLALSLF
jgi:hypothetical protein